MDDAWLNRYIDAWVLHPVAGTTKGGGELKSLVDCFTTDVRYEDVPTASVFVGHDGIKQMCKLAHQWSSDFEIKVLTRQTNGSLFALETESAGTNTAPLGDLPASGRRFVLRTVSIGSVDGQGLVREHRDYWDLGGFLVQIGVLPAMT
jgi:SnoaL-like polyketide cyclase